MVAQDMVVILMAKVSVIRLEFFPENSSIIMLVMLIFRITGGDGDPSFSSGDTWSSHCRDPPLLGHKPGLTPDHSRKQTDVSQKHPNSLHFLNTIEPSCPIMQFSNRRRITIDSD